MFKQLVAVNVLLAAASVALSVQLVRILSVPPRRSDGIAEEVAHLLAIQAHLGERNRPTSQS